MSDLNPDSNITNMIAFTPCVISVFSIFSLFSKSYYKPSIIIIMITLLLALYYQIKTSSKILKNWNLYFLLGLLMYSYYNYNNYNFDYFLMMTILSIIFNPFLWMGFIVSAAAELAPKDR